MIRRAHLRWLLTCVLLAAAGLIAAFFFGAGYYLQAPAREPVAADLLVALGGDNGARAVRVLELYQKGFGPKVLLTGPEGAHSKVLPVHQLWRGTYLIQEGIPEKAILYDSKSRNSWEEAVNTLKLMREQKMERVLVVSDPPHLRRLAWVWGKVFRDSGKSFVLVASDDEEWDAEHWWRTSGNAQYVFAEYIKLAYYLIQH